MVFKECGCTSSLLYNGIAVNIFVHNYQYSLLRLIVSVMQQTTTLMCTGMEIFVTNENIGVR